MFLEIYPPVLRTSPLVRGDPAARLAIRSRCVRRGGHKAILLNFPGSYNLKGSNEIQVFIAYSYGIRGVVSFSFPLSHLWEKGQG